MPKQLAPAMVTRLVAKLQSVLCSGKQECNCSCNRAIAVPLLLYVGLFSVTWMFSLPLHSGHISSLHKEQQSVHETAELSEAEHLDAVRIERDGDINKNFRKEVLLGEEEDDNIKDPRATLEDVFKKADADGNGLISPTELTTWINLKIQEHLTQALQENFMLFASIDNDPRNGVVSWDEYHAHFLKQKGLSKEYVKKHDKKHRGLSRTVKEAIMRDRASWSEAARNDPESLNLDEFLAFRHPESSHATILTLVEELLDKFDRDGDAILTEEEFSRFHTEGDEEKEGETLTQGEEERRREFREAIDLNADGKADRKELLMYIDPRNPRHAKEEAETLIVLSDTDHDGNLSLKEVLNKMDLFLGSKMVNTAKSFHDEF